MLEAVFPRSMEEAKSIFVSAAAKTSTIYILPSIMEYRDGISGQVWFSSSLFNNRRRRRVFEAGFVSWTGLD